MWYLHNKVTEDPSILLISRKWNTEYLTIVKLYLGVWTHNGKWPVDYTHLTTAIGITRSFTNYFFKESFFLTLLKVSRVIPRKEAIYFNGIRLAR
jgi:hypothetical protein